MYGLVVASVAILCLSQVAADNHGCVNENNTYAVNETVSELDTLFTPIVDGSGSIDEKTEMILQEICNKTKTDGGYEKTKVIEKIIAECRAVISETSLYILNLNGLTFIDMFERFSSVDNFCGCILALQSALALNPYKNDLMDNPADVKYPFIKVSVLCSSDAAKMAVSSVADSLKMCPNVYKYTEFLTATNPKLMKDFADKECSKLNETKFTCAVDYSKTADFKTCTTDAGKTTGDTSTACKRAECVAKSDCHEDGWKWYMLAVNMQKDNEGKFSVDTCNGVSSFAASFSVLIVALFAMLLY